MVSPIATEVHTASDLHRNQWSDKTFQEYIQNFTYLTEKAMAVDATHIKNRVIIFLFIKNLFNHYIQKQIAEAKIINAQADVFKLAHQNLLKLKKYKGLL